VCLVKTACLIIITFWPTCAAVIDTSICLVPRPLGVQLSLTAGRLMLPLATVQHFVATFEMATK